MKKAIFISMLIIGLSISMNAQNVKFWTENKIEGENYVVSIYGGLLNEGSDSELLKGVNLRYYYEGAELLYQSFALSPALLDADFQNFGGQGNNAFRSDDVSRSGTADRFVGHAPFVFDGGLEIHSGDRVKLGTLTFRKKPGVNVPDIESYLVGAKIFRAMTYTALPGCADGCPVIVVAPPAQPRPVVGIELDVVKYGPANSHLTWVVDAPDDMRGYIVERRIDNGSWEQLADLKAEGQYVNVYVDENAFDGMKRQQAISYRIRATALQGEQMSDIENLDFDAQKMFIEVFPNPASDKVQLTMTATETQSEAWLEIYATDGRLVYRNPLLPGSTKEQIDLASANIDSGSYTVHLVSGSEILDVRALHVMR